MGVGKVKPAPVEPLVQVLEAGQAAEALRAFVCAVRAAAAPAPEPGCVAPVWQRAEADGAGAPKAGSEAAPGGDMPMEVDPNLEAIFDEMAAADEEGPPPAQRRAATLGGDYPMALRQQVGES